MTWLAEKFAQAISWNLAASLHFPSRASIDGVFSAREFERESRPLWGASPFNNHIFIFRRSTRKLWASASGAPVPVTKLLSRPRE